jgi:opacity protein-like surface antigen
MRRYALSIVIRAALCAAVATAAFAQTWEVAPYASYLRLSRKPLGSLNSVAKDDDTKLRETQPAYGARLTLNVTDYYGLELNYLRGRARIDSRIVPAEGTDPVLQSGTINYNQISFNGLAYFLPRGERLRPFITAGAQLNLWPTPPLADWAGGGSKNLGFNYGGGLKIKITKNVLVRLDARHMMAGAPYGLKYEDASVTATPRGPGLYSHIEGSLGIGISF